MKKSLFLFEFSFFSVFTADFCINVLAGVVASTIFIHNNDLLLNRTILCTALCLILEVINVKLVKRFVSRSVEEFLNDPRPAPPMPTGARP